MTDFLMHGRSRGGGVAPKKSSSGIGGGSNNGSSGTRRVASERRRLTLSAIEPQNHKEGGNSSNKTGPLDAAGLIQMLKETSVSNIVKTQRRKISFSSVTHEGTSVASQQDSFADKPTTNTLSQRDELNRLGIGLVCRKGKKPESPNQDSFSFLHIADELLLLGVYDGHGSHGHHVSQFVKDILPKLFLSDPNRVKDPKKALTDSFNRCQRLVEHAEKSQNLQAGLSGTTCTLVYQPLCYKEKGNKRLYIAHCGDSRATLVYKNNGVIKGKNLTEDHKPSLPAEKRRIEANGGRVIFDGFFNHRVFAANRLYPGLNMSRAFGDTVAHREAGLCATPDVTEHQISAGGDKDEDIALLVCSDGVWEFCSAQDAAQCVTNNGKGGILSGNLMSNKSNAQGVQSACEELSKKAWNSWMEDSENEISDDITALLVKL